MIKPIKIKRSKEYYLKHIRNAKLDLEELKGKDKTKRDKDIVRLRGKLNEF